MILLLVQKIGGSPFHMAHSVLMGQDDQIIALKRRLGLSRRRLAALIGIDESNIAGWESGRHSPTARSIEIIREFLTYPSFEVLEE
jgi:transcriptional regulator with XRE-family HTH domain